MLLKGLVPGGQRDARVVKVVRTLPIDKRIEASSQNVHAFKYRRGTSCNSRLRDEKTHTWGRGNCDTRVHDEDLRAFAMKGQAALGRTTLGPLNSPCHELENNLSCIGRAIIVS